MFFVLLAIGYHTEFSQIRHGDWTGLIAVCPHDVQLTSTNHDLWGIMGRFDIIRVRENLMATEGNAVK